MISSINFYSSTSSKKSSLYLIFSGEMQLLNSCSLIMNLLLYNFNLTVSHFQSDAETLLASLRAIFQTENFTEIKDPRPPPPWLCTLSSLNVPMKGSLFQTVGNPSTRKPCINWTLPQSATLHPEGSSPNESRKEVKGNPFSSPWSLTPYYKALFFNWQPSLAVSGMKDSWST